MWNNFSKQIESTGYETGGFQDKSKKVSEKDISKK